MKKRIAIHDLRPGMYVTSLDQSWLKTPFLRHFWQVKNEEEIQLLRRHGVQELFIDTSKGLDVADVETHQQDEAPSSISATPSRLIQTKETDKAKPGSMLGPDLQELEVVRALRAEAIHVLDNFFEHVESDIDSHLPQIRNIVSSLLEGLFNHQVAMISLSQMRRFDNQLSTHVVDTCVLSLAMAHEHGVDTVQLKALGLGALLHDVGHLRLPLNILRKREPFTEQDHKLMKLHPEMSRAIIAEASDIPEETKTIVAQHHERVNGTGYPYGLQGQDISVLSQLLSIADTYDAQISGRCSSPPTPPAQALGELYKAGTEGQYDPLLVQRLIQFLGVYPIGSLVRLTTGEQAVVVWVHAHARLKPCIKLLADPLGRPYVEQEIIDLSTQDSKTHSRAIVDALDPKEEKVDIPKVLESLW